MSSLSHKRKSALPKDPIPVENPESAPMPAVVGQIVISFLADGSIMENRVTESGLPLHPVACVMAMQAVQTRYLQETMQMAKQGSDDTTVEAMKAIAMQEMLTKGLEGPPQ